MTMWSVDPWLSRDIAKEYKLMINGPEAGVDMYFDKVEVSNYSRDRTWKSASDLRIDELRKNDVTFKECAIDLKWPFMNPDEILYFLTLRHLRRTSIWTEKDRKSRG